MCRAAKVGSGDILCEMRFHVPNNELEIYQQERHRQRQEERKQRKAAAGEEEKKGESESEEGSLDDDMTAAKLFDAKIHEKANIGAFAGEVVAQIRDLPMLIPRGNYSLDFYSNFCKLHGKTHDYKIMFKDINKIFMLTKPDGVHQVYVLHLDQPLRQGMTLHYYIVMNFEVERETSVAINLPPEQIAAKYGDALQPELEGKLYDVLSKLFNHLVGIKRIIIAGQFQSARGTQAIKCSVRAAEGYLYPLRHSIVFIHKPVLYIRHAELKCVEFSRVGEGTAGLSRSFDITLTKLKDDSQVTFLSIDKEEQGVLQAYFKQSGVKVRTVDVDTQQQVDSEDEDAPEEPESKRKRRGPGATQDIDADMDDDEEEDEDFVDDGGDQDSDDEEDGEEEESAEEDMSMIDEGVDKDELKNLQKDTEVVSGKRKRPAKK